MNNYLSGPSKGVKVSQPDLDIRQIDSLCVS